MHTTTDLPPTSSWRLWAPAVLAVALCGLIALGLRHAQVPAPVAADAPATAFSSARALVHLRQIARESHPTGSPANAAVRDYLVTQLRALGLAPEVHSGVGLRARGKVLAAGHVDNVLVRLPGTVPGKAVLLAAHYDSAPLSLGAADDGASVAAILETLRALKAGAPLRNDVMVLLTDGEEAGLLGSEAFTSADPWAKQVGVVFNFEYRGTGGPMLMYETSNGNGALIAGLHSAPKAMGNSLMFEVYKRMPNDTDMTEFRKAGMAGLNFGAIEGVTRYHTALDRVDQVEEGSIQHQGETLLALARHFGDAPLDALKAGDSVYFDVAGLGLVSYPVAYVLPLCALAALLFGAAVWRARRASGVRTTRVGVAALIFLVLAALFAFGAQLLWQAVRALHPQYNLMLLGDTYNSAWYLPAFSALALGLFALTQNGLGKRFQAAELGLGAALFWLLLLSAASLLAPGASFLLLWPLLPVLLSFIVLATAWGKAQSHSLRAAILLLGAAPGIVLFAPFVRQIFIALTPQMAGVAVLLVVLMLGLMTPLLALMGGRRALPGGAVLVGALLMAGAATEAGFSNAAPRPNNLSYVQHGTDGYWLSSDRALDAWTRQFFPGEKYGTVPAVYGDSGIERFYASAPARGLAQPEAAIEADVTADGKRTLTLRVRSGRAAPKVLVAVEGVTVEQASIEGRSIGGLPAKQWQFDLFGLPAAGSALRLTVPAATPFKLRLTDMSYELALDGRAARRSDMMAQPFRDSDTTRVVRVIEVQ